MFLFNQSQYIDRTLQCTELFIGDGVMLVPFPGKHLTMTVDGVHQNIAPGYYSGNIVLSVTDAIPRKEIMGSSTTGFTAALYGENGKILPEKSVQTMIKGGTVQDGLIQGVEIKSKGHVVGGIDLVDGQWTIKDANISMEGYGDCNGKGASVYIGGTAEVEIDNLTAYSAGVSRSAVVVTDKAKVTIRNSNIRTLDGDAAQEKAAAADVGGMLGVPWQLGLKGNCRATQVLSSSSVDYIDSTIESYGWGVLSVDGVMPSESFEQFTAHLGAKNCKVRVTGPSGYGAFTIGPCQDVFENTDFQVSDYGLIQANETASAIYDHCTVDSGRFGVMSYSNQGGTVEIRDSKFNTKNATFLIKGCYPQYVVERSELHSEDGIVIQLMDMDDLMLNGGGDTFDASVAEKDPDHDVTKVNLRDFKLFGRVDVHQKPTDVQATFRDMTLQGDIFNGTTNATGITYFDMSAIPDDLPQDGAPGGFGAPEGAPPAGFEMPQGGPPARFEMPQGGPPAGFGAPPAGFEMPQGGPPAGFEMPQGGPPAGFDGPPAGFPAMGEDAQPPEMPAFEPSYSTKVPTNLAVYFEGVDYTGCISATTAKHAVKECIEENYHHIGVVTNVISPVVNNGVIISLDGTSSWTVTGSGYLSALHIAPGAKIVGADGKPVTMLVDGVETPICAGDYKGAIEIRI